MDFDERIKKAIERGSRTREAKQRHDAEKALSEEELKSLHTKYRLEVSERIEACVGKLPDHFPGFKFETMIGERGWGAAVSRDDLAIQKGERNNLFSRLEMVVRPYASYHVLELAAKGTIRNREAYNRKHFQKLADVDLETFFESIDLWLLEYAELYSARA